MEWTIHDSVQDLLLEEKFLPDYQKAVLEKMVGMGFHSLVAARN